MSKEMRNMINDFGKLLTENNNLNVEKRLERLVSFIEDNEDEKEKLSIKKNQSKRLFIKIRLLKKLFTKKIQQDMNLLKKSNQKLVIKNKSCWMF